jgi:hypothetical protein
VNLLQVAHNGSVALLGRFELGDQLVFGQLLAAR